ncbi:MAG: glutaredoxin family protein [Pseudohongiellaceae bacterium]
MKKLILYTTDGCHLCEYAHQMLQPLEASHQITLQLIDIATDKNLIDKYGVHIPVIKNPITNDELNWPFTTTDALEIL